MSRRFDSFRLVSDLLHARDRQSEAMESLVRANKELVEADSEVEDFGRKLKAAFAQSPGLEGVQFDHKHSTYAITPAGDSIRVIRLGYSHDLVVPEPEPEPATLIHEAFELPTDGAHASADDDDDGCPVDDPDCIADNGACHDACERSSLAVFDPELMTAMAEVY